MGMAIAMMATSPATIRFIASSNCREAVRPRCCEASWVLRSVRSSFDGPGAIDDPLRAQVGAREWAGAGR
jgi:hypothetical protein